MCSDLNESRWLSSDINKRARRFFLKNKKKTVIHDKGLHNPPVPSRESKTRIIFS